MIIRKYDISWNYISTLISITTNLIMLPIIMYFLDANLIGLWGVYISISSIVILLDFGFSPTFSRNIAYAWSGSSMIEKTGIIQNNTDQPNYILMKKILYASKKTYLYISVIALFSMIFIGTPYILHVSKEININTLLISWGVYSVAIFFNIYFGYYGAYLRGVGAIKRLSQSIIFSKLIQISVSIALLILGLDLIGVTVAYLLSGLVFRFFSRSFFYKHHNIGKIIKGIIVLKNDVRDIFFTIWHNAWRDGLVSLSNFFTVQASVIISSIFLTLAETGVYSISIQLVTVISTVSTALYSAYQPAIQSAFVKDDKDKLVNYLSISSFVYNVVYWFGVFALLIIGIPLLNLISSDVFIDINFLIVLSIYFYLLKQHSLFASFISNRNSIPYVKAFVLSGLLSIVLQLTLFIFFELGIYSLVMAQMIAQLLYNNWYWPKQFLKSLRISYVKTQVIGMKQVVRLIKRGDWFK